MPRPADEDTITFQAAARYWGMWNKKDLHDINPEHMVKLGRTKFGLIKTRNIRWSSDPAFPIKAIKTCKRATITRGSPGWYQYTEVRYCSNSHTVAATEVYDWCIEQLDMIEKGAVTEKIVEKIVEKRVVIDKIIEVPKGYVGTFEKREVLAFALTRELRGTEKALRQAYIDNNADESLRLAARVDVIREVMADLDIDLIEGAPQIVVARSFSKTGGLFDGLRAGPDHT